MNCKNCGAILNPNQEYCTNCGTKVENAQSLDNNLYNNPSTENYINNYNQNNNMVTNQGVNNQQNVFQNYPTNQQQVNNSNKSNKGLIALIIGILVVVIGGVAGFIFIRQAFNYLNDAQDKIEDYTSRPETVYLNKISFEYNSSIWSKKSSLSDEDKITLVDSFGTITVTHNSSKVYYQTETFSSEMKSSLKEQGMTIKEETSKVTINGKDWYKIVYSSDSNNRTAMTLFFCDYYDVYSFTYAANSDSYSFNLSEVEKIYKTLTYDNSANEIAEKDAKSKLTGEWDWGISGYFVIDQNTMYLYKDSSKDMNNVFYGTYTADNKVATAAAGYVDGLYAHLTVTNFNLDGEAQDTTNMEMEFVFIPNNDGTYTIENLVSQTYGTATKVK